MDSEVTVFGLLILYEVSTLIAGVAVIFMGYRLFHAGLERVAGEMQAKTPAFSITLRTAAPGTFFALFGALIISISVFRGASYVPKSADVAISDTQPQIPSVQILIPSTPPPEGGKK